MRVRVACLLLILLAACLVRAQDTQAEPTALTTATTSTTVTTTATTSSTDAAPAAIPKERVTVEVLPTAAPLVIAAPTVAPSAPADPPKAVAPQCLSFKPGFCTREYNPVCGFLANGTSITFANNCTACSFSDMKVFVEGVCQSSKTTAPTTPPPVSGPTTSDPNTPTVDRITLSQPPTPGTPYTGTLADATANGGASVAASFVPLIVACPESQARYLATCTREYRPVCAVHLNLTKRTYASPCAACLDGSVAHYRTTPCTATEIKDNSKAATTCQHDILPFCRLNYSPVCAYGSDGSKRTQSNGCLACIDKKIIAYRNGECENTSPSKTRLSLCGRDANESLLCLLQWNEVCVTLSNSANKQFANGCDACLSRDWVSYRPGKCSVPR